MSLEILLVRYSAIGDVVLSTAVINSIGELFPDVQIDILAGDVANTLLEGNPHIRRIIPLSPKKDFWKAVRELRKKRYDVLINLQGNNRSAFLSAFLKADVKVGSHPSWSFPYDRFIKDRNERIHAVDFYFRVVKLVFPDIEKRFPAIYLFDEEIDNIRNKLKSAGISGKFFCFSPAVSCSSREWLPEYYIRLGRFFVSNGVRIVVLGGSSLHDRELAEYITAEIGDGAYDFAGKLSLRELAAISRMCKLFFSGDTGPMHIAAAVGTRVVAFFGPSDPVRARPLGAGHIVFFDSGLSCLGCYKKECEDKLCMYRITPEMVIRRLGF